MEFSSNAKIEADAADACGPRRLADPAGLNEAEPPRGRARLLSALLATASVPFAGLGPRGEVVCANKAFVASAAAAGDDPEGRALESFVNPADRAGVRDALDRVGVTGAPAIVPCRFTRDAGDVPAEVAFELDGGSDECGPAGFLAFAHDLTERQRAETALRESEERFRRLYDEAPVGYHEVDAEGTLVNINRTECELLGYDHADLIGRPVFGMLAEEFRETARRAFPDKIAGRRPLAPFERTVETRDGRRLVIAIEERYRRDPAGNVVGLFSTVRDVTEQRRVEAALVRSERRARTLFEGMEDAVFVHARDGRILDANPAASRLLGYSREEFLSLTTADVDAPEFAAGFKERLRRQETDGHLACEGCHRTKDGRVIPVEIRTSMIQLDDEPAVLAVVRDVSERQALEQTRRAFAEAQAANARELAEANAELTLSESRYRRLTESCLDGVVVADREARATLFNPASERMFGYSAVEVLGRPLSVLMPGAFAEGPAPPAWSAYVGRTVEVVGRRKSGEDFPVELSLSLADRGGETQLIGSIRDQTERQRMRAMLTQSERLASIGLLSAGVAHEINNPLAYVGNNLAVLERDLATVVELVALYEGTRPALEASEPEALARIDALSDEFDWPYVRENLPRMLSRSRDGVRRVANIVASLRTLARTTPMKKEDVAIPELLESSLEMLRGRLRRGQIEVVVEHGDVPKLSCIPPQISQVLLNLLINATQAVELGPRQSDGRIVFRSESVGDTVVLSVSDNGAGIDPEDVPRLFDPFFTTKGLGEGTGLGLSICHGIVTGHGGRIEVDTRPGHGATFRLVFPRDAP